MFVCCVCVASSQQRTLGGGRLGGVVTAWKHVTVDVHGHHDGGMPEALLNHLSRQFEAAVGAAIDTPRIVEVAQGLKARMFGADEIKAPSDLLTVDVIPAAICDGATPRVTMLE